MRVTLWISTAFHLDTQLHRSDPWYSENPVSPERNRTAASPGKAVENHPPFPAPNSSRSADLEDLLPKLFVLWKFFDIVH
jgi:hypothetical protein